MQQQQQSAPQNLHQNPQQVVAQNIHQQQTVPQNLHQQPQPITLNNVRIPAQSIPNALFTSFFLSFSLPFCLSHSRFSFNMLDQVWFRSTPHISTRFSTWGIKSLLRLNWYFRVPSKFKSITYSIHWIDSKCNNYRKRSTGMRMHRHRFRRRRLRLCLKKENSNCRAVNWL